MDNLRDFLKNEQTHPGLGKAIVKILNSWHGGDDVDVSTLPGGHNVHHAAALHQRDLLGWESFIHGQWHGSWHQVQHRYLQSLGRFFLIALSGICGFTVITSAMLQEGSKIGTGDDRQILLSENTTRMVLLMSSMRETIII
jgi:hypothetical protein